MANEISILSKLTVRKGNLNYSSSPSSFRADMTGTKGPSPGLLTITTTGENVSFAELDTPGEVWIQNLDATNYVEFGIHDGSLFHPVGEILPGKDARFRLSRNLGEEEDLPGTGTSAVVNAFYLRANGASCAVRVDAFDS